MKKTNRLFSLFAAIAISATMLADVVYEPLIVDSGFNRDVIAENEAITGYASSPLYVLPSTASCFATDSVIAKKNKNYFSSSADYERTVRSGWPSDFGNPEDRMIRCTSDGDAIENPDYSQVKWLLAPYDGPNALCIRPTNPKEPSKVFQGKGTLKFKKIGCYDRLYFLMISLREGTPDESRHVQTTIYYTEGDTTYRDFDFENGLGGMPGRKVCMTNIYETQFKKNTAVTGKYQEAFACVFDITLDKTRLVDSIVFENPVPKSGAIILAVTGRTADIAAPNEEVAQTSNIQENSFEACWDYIADAASYRLDVAEDIDFQHLVAGYNNLNVGNTTCQEVAGLLADNDYYWRVRSVNAQGGQSASSAPRRVKTAGGETPATDETHTDIAAELESWLETTVSSIEIDRKLYRDGYYNTLCLPFNLSAAEIDASPLAGAQIYKYVRATKVSDAQLDIEVEDTTGITAGVPYLITWAPTSPEIIDNGILTFHNVYIRTNEGQTIGGADEVRFVGNIARAQMENGDHNNLFIGANNTLYWPNTDNKLRGFRAYFQVPLEGPAAVSPGAPARIVEHHQTTTEVNIVVNPMSQNESVRKVLRDGRIYILRDGKRYSILGQNVE